MARRFFVILAVTMLFGATGVLAGERETPRAGEVKIIYNGDFLPPHIEARNELEKIREEWLAQELDTLFTKHEERENDE